MRLSTLSAVIYDFCQGWCQVIPMTDTSKIMAIPHSKKRQQTLFKLIPSHQCYCEFPSTKKGPTTWKELAPSGSRTSIGHCAIAVAEGNTITDPWGIDNSFGKEVAIFHDFFWFLLLLIGAQDSHQGRRMQQAMQVLDRMSPSHLLLSPRANLQFSKKNPCC